MLRKKVGYFLIGVLLGSNVVYGENIDNSTDSSDVNLNYELKIGITPFESYGSSHSSERFDDGVDFGIEAYRSLDKYAFGFGGEVKRKVDKDYIKGNNRRLYTYYFLAKRRITDYYSIVGRLGKTSQKEFDSKFYGAIGIEKSIGRLNIQLLAETTKLENNLNDKNYNSIGLKIGYVFGDIQQSKPKFMEPLPIEIQEPLKKEPVIEPLIIQDEELTGGYEAYITDVPVGKIDGIKLFVTKVNEHDKPGFLEMTAYSDITGSKKLNVMLANERMDKLENELRNNNLKEEVKVIRIDPHETVKNFYKFDNNTFENRKLNRRIEVNFIEE